MQDNALRTTMNLVSGVIYVCDPIHGNYKIKKPYSDIVLTKEMQRLKEITQTGFSYFDYPEMMYEDRLAHSLGAYHIMEKIMNKLSNLLKNTNIKISNDDKEIALCAILLHDIGHGPFSHSFEAITNYSHEKRTTDILLGDTEVNKVLTSHFGPAKTRRIASFIAEIDESEKKDGMFESTVFTRLIKSLISHQIDADRLDYLVRDAYYANKESSINIDKIIDAISIVMNAYGEYEIIMDKKNLTLIETPLIERFQHYRDIYFTPGSVLGDKVFKNLLREMKENYDEGLMSMLPAEFNELVLYPTELNLDVFLKLTDELVKKSLDIIRRESESPLIRRLANPEGIIKDYIIFEDIFIKDKILELLSQLSKTPVAELTSDNSIFEIYYKTKFYKKDEGFKVRCSQTILDLTDVTNLVNARDYVETKLTAFNIELFYFENKFAKKFGSKKKFYDLVNKYIGDIKEKEEEFELKYLVLDNNPNSAQKVLDLLKANNFQVTNEKEYYNNDIYFDTEDCKLYHEGKILRIREKGNKFIGTYKAPLSDGNIYTSRIEIEEELTEKDVYDLMARIENRGYELPSNIIENPQLIVANLRNEVILSKNGARVSFCIDKVKYIIGNSKSFNEVMIEIEAINDAEDRFLLTEINEIIESYVKNMHIELEITNSSKYSRGMDKIV